MERPILFSTDMVKAILNGSKVCTRRVVTNLDLVQGVEDGIPYFVDEYGDWHKTESRCQYGQAGGLLWVRETFAPYIRGNGGNGYVQLIRYRADNAEIKVGKECLETWEHLENNGYHWRPSIHMHKIFARIWLKVKSVRVERLQDITHADAKKEGIPSYVGSPPFQYPTCPIEGFEKLWNSINGKPRKDDRDISWKTSPWVYVVEFELTKKPQVAIDVTETDFGNMGQMDEDQAGDQIDSDVG